MTLTGHIRDKVCEKLTKLFYIHAILEGLTNRLHEVLLTVHYSLVKAENPIAPLTAHLVGVQAVCFDTRTE